ncbi:MAG TPA: alkaline phosphatase family protein [Terriglobia bacterium]|nr:alkaline phosphatase family protein [Terriglobia bacterium]
MPQEIEHVIVLMMENRSFDHMLGWLQAPGYDLDGLTGNEWNPMDPSGPPGPNNKIGVTRNAQDVTPHDPGHEFHDVNVQLFSNPGGPPLPGGVEANQGFVFSYAQQDDVTKATAPTIMDCFDPGNLPVLTTLAKEFAVCKRWFSSVPGPTWPNRFFAHAATSKGYLDNSQLHNYDMKSIFENLSAAGRTWSNYYHEISQTWALQRLDTDTLRNNFKGYGEFRKDAAAGKLPNYSFIEPKYYWWFGGASDQHPPHSIKAGEALIADVYHCVRTSPLWEKSLLLVVYDEHGGFYDHVTPAAATPPDAYQSQFKFDRYGVRVPAILISPYIQKGTIVGEAFDHTSIPATLKELFKLESFLTERDAAARTFSGVPDLASERKNTPEDVSTAVHSRIIGEGLHEPAADEISAAAKAGDASSAPLTGLQRHLIGLANSLPTGEDPELRAHRNARSLQTEFDGALHVRETVARHLRHVRGAK